MGKGVVLEMSVGEETPAEEEFRFHTVGEQLKAERERQSLTLQDMATRTRVPMRHLESIEKSDFGALPGTTYTLGFTRSYAKSLGLDEAKIAEDLRDELAAGGHESYKAPVPGYEPADPARVPPRALAWIAAAIGVLLVAGYLFWRSYMLGGDVTDPAAAPKTVVAKVEQKDAASATPAAPANGEVVLTATDTVWVKVYDAENKRLYEKEMQAGDKFAVPADANKPMIVTGRPQAVTVTVAGQTVAPLGPPDRTIADVELTAAALAARPPASATTEASATTPAPSAGN